MKAIALIYASLALIVAGCKPTPSIQSNAKGKGSNSQGRTSTNPETLWQANEDSRIKKLENFLFRYYKVAGINLDKKDEWARTVMSGNIAIKRVLPDIHKTICLAKPENRYFKLVEQLGYIQKNLKKVFEIENIYWLLIEQFTLQVFELWQGLTPDENFNTVSNIPGQERAYICRSNYVPTLFKDSNFKEKLSEEYKANRGKTTIEINYLIKATNNVTRKQHLEMLKKIQQDIAVKERQKRMKN